MNTISERKLKDWRAFIKIVEKQSITAAAEAMCIEASTVSKYLTQLEESLGISLVERTTRSLKITSQGIEVYERMKVILGSIDDLFRELDDKRKHMAGRLRIAAPAVVCEFQLGECIINFQKVNPHACFHLHAVGRHEDINPADFDLIIRGGPLSESAQGLVNRRMDNVNLLVCASPAYLNALPMAINHPSELAGHELLTLWDHTFSGPVNFTKDGEKSFVMPAQSSRFTTNNVLAQFNLMLRGAGISVATPSWLAYDYLERGEVVRLLPDWKIQECEVHMIWMARKYYSPLFLNFTDYLDERWRERKKIVDV